MKQFKPKMSDGMGNAKDMAPEAHNEWADKEGKHVAKGISGLGASASGMVPSSKVGPDGFEPEGASKQGSTHAHEGKQIAKGKHSPASQGLFAGSAGKSKSGFPIGPKKHAGKDGSGAVKEAGGKGKLNRGNGLKKGAK